MVHFKFLWDIYETVLKRLVVEFFSRRGCREQEVKSINLNFWRHHFNGREEKRGSNPFAKDDFFAAKES